MVSTELWAGVLSSAVGFLLLMITVVMHHEKIKIWKNKIIAYFNPYMQITIHEYGAERFHRSDFFVAIEAYLSDKWARKLKAELDRDSMVPQLSIDDDQEIIDNFDTGADGAATLWWYAMTELLRSQVIIRNPGDEKNRFYRVKFHKKFHKSIETSYLPRVIEKGHDVIARNRHRRLFTNSTSRDQRAVWSHVAFQHPATFDTLAMNLTEKKAIIDDLSAFKEGEEFYARCGKAWKRGYLLFGPPGTGKSTMIAAMAKYLKYDVYDLELTAVKNNTELRKLFVETKGKSIIVIEDIDRSIDLIDAKPRNNNACNKKSSTESDDMTLLPKKKGDKEDDESNLTLSGLLNFIDGLWSACGGERIIIFTTNDKDKLDPALIRRGRMDKHIEMSYCRFEAFTVLASNYLGIPETEHQLFVQFGEIQRLLEEVDMTPADVAEHLRKTEKRDANACLRDLVVALKKAKHDAAVKGKAKAKEDVNHPWKETGVSGS